MNGAHLLEEIELPLLVIDASVIVKWFKTENEGLLPEAQAIYDAHGETILATVPPLCLFEIGNSLWKHQYFTAEQIEQKLMDLRELELRVVDLNGEGIRTAVRLCRSYTGVTFYDATYVALAKQLDTDLITADPNHQKITDYVYSLEEWWEYSKRLGTSSMP